MLYKPRCDECKFDDKCPHVFNTYGNCRLYISYLDPCPFCGAAAEQLVRKPRKAPIELHCIQCSNTACLIRPTTPWYSTLNAAKAVWNTRKDC